MLISCLEQLPLRIWGSADIEILLLIMQVLLEFLKLRSCCNATSLLIDQLAFSRFQKLMKFQVFFLAVVKLLAQLENTALARLVLQRLGLKS